MHVHAFMLAACIAAKEPGTTHGMQAIHLEMGAAGQDVACVRVSGEGALVTLPSEKVPLGHVGRTSMTWTTHELFARSLSPKSSVETL